MFNSPHASHTNYVASSMQFQNVMYIIYILHIICMETKRKTAYLCFLYFREWRDPIQNRRRKLSFTSLIKACFKFKYPASLNPRFTTILHLCAIQVVLELSTKLYGIPSGSQITSILQNSTIPDKKMEQILVFTFQRRRRNITLSCHFKMDARK